MERLHEGSEPLPAPELRRYRIDLDSGRLSEERIAEPLFELPRINYARNGKPYRFAYGLTPAADGGWTDTVLKLDLETSHAKTWHEHGAYPGEPVFVAPPGASREDDGVLLSVVLDVEAGSSYLLVLDAQDLTERARARVPHHIPFSFHGQYTSHV